MKPIDTNLPHRRVAIFVRDGIALSSLHLFRDLTHLADIAMARRRVEREEGADTPKLAGTLRVQVVSGDGAPVRASSGELIEPVAPLSKTKPLGLLFVPSQLPLLETLDPDPHEAEAPDTIAELWRDGTLIAGAGSGVALLARAGILDGRRAATSWPLQEAFRARFPAVKLDRSRQITEDTNIFCAASLGSELMLASQLLSRLNTNWVGETLAKLTLPVFYDPEAAHPPITADLAKTTDIVVSRALLWIAQNYTRRFRTAELATMLSISERTLLRRFQQATNLTPHAYMRRLRLASAARSIELTSLPLKVVAARVGYNDLDFFKYIFTAEFGMSPLEFRRNAETRKHGD